MSTTTQDDDVLRSFTGFLESSTPLTIPDETLYGAITHFLSTLQSSHLKSFVELLITSHSLWLQKERSRQISEATKLAVFAKIEALNKQFERAYFPAYRREKHAKKWASDIKDCVIASESSVSRRALLVGLAEGMKGFNINWGKIQEEVEEELVLEAASLGASDEGIETLCPILNHVSEERLWALDLADILPKLHERIQGEQDPDLAKAFGRLLKVMDNGQEDHRRQAWAEMKSFCSDPLIEHSSFLVVAEGIIDILVQSEPPSIASSSRDTTHLSADIASDIIYQLFAHPQEDSTERAYQYALCGSLDIIEARGGPDAVARLIGRLVPGSPDSLRPEQAAFVFSVAEQTVNLLDASTVRDVLLPLCQDHLRMTDKSNSFEAAHEFLIALVKSFVDAPGDQRVQIPFMSELLSWYARVLLRQFIDEDVTADQLKAAYPTVADASAHCGDTVIHNCINLVLDRLSSVKEPGKAQALRALRIELASYVPFPDLAQYLDDLAWCILDSESGTRYRSILAEAAYHMVIQGLPDESRKMGMEWWLKWKDAFEDKDKERAKL